MKKDMEEHLVVAGNRQQWLSQFEANIQSVPGFKKVIVDSTLYQVSAKYKRGTAWGDILVTFVPHGSDTEVRLRSSAHVDNIYALFSSPNKKILGAAKSAFS